MTIYVYDAKLGKVVPKEERRRRPQIQIIRDIEPYKSMATGERITSRSHHKEHLRTHRLEEVGNERMESKKTPLDRARRRSDIAKSLSGMSDSQASEIMTSLENQYRRR